MHLLQEPILNIECTSIIVEWYIRCIFHGFVANENSYTWYESKVELSSASAAYLFCWSKIEEGKKLKTLPVLP